MPEYDHLYSTAKWKRVRKQFLFDYPRCISCLGRNKLTPATEVDHITPHLGDLILFWDDENYQSLCKSCHSRKTWHENKGIAPSGKYLPRTIKPKSSDITLLFGAPCSGKTTWAEKQGCDVMDFDDIKRRVSGQDPYDMDIKYLNTCFHVRNDIISNTKEKLIVIGSLSDIDVRTDWIKKLKAKPLYMITPEYECIRRLKATDRPNINGQIALIKRWFKDFIPSGYEQFVV